MRENETDARQVAIRKKKREEYLKEKQQDLNKNHDELTETFDDAECRDVLFKSTLALVREYLPPAVQDETYLMYLKFKEHNFSAPDNAPYALVLVKDKIS